MSAHECGSMSTGERVSPRLFYVGAYLAPAKTGYSTTVRAVILCQKLRLIPSARLESSLLELTRRRPEHHANACLVGFPPCVSTMCTFSHVRQQARIRPCILAYLPVAAPRPVLSITLSPRSRAPLTPTSSTTHLAHANSTRRGTR